MQQKFFNLRLKFILTSIGIVVLHYWLASTSTALSFEHGVTPLWPSAGLFLAANLLLGYRILPIIFVSNLAIIGLTVYKDSSMVVITMSAIADLTITLLASILIQRFIGYKNLMENAQNVLRFILCILSVGWIGATIGTATLCFSGVTMWSSYGDTWRNWVTGDISGLLIVTPGILLLFQRTNSPTHRHPYLSRQYGISGMGILLAIGAIAWLTFWLGYPVEYIFIPVLIWAAFRWGQREATLLVILISGIAVWKTATGASTFVQNSSKTLVLLECFTISIAITTYILCAVINENKRAASQLKQANEYLEFRVAERTAQLENTLQELQRTQVQMVQVEKMSSLSQQQLELALRAAKMGVWYWDVATNTITWTTEAEQVFGLEPGTFGGSLQAFIDRLHPDELERVNLALQRALVGKEKYYIEYRSIFPDGTIHWMETQGDVLLDDCGNPTSMIGVVREISDRKQAQKEQARLLAILASTSDFVGTSDPNGQILYLNQAGRKMLGLTPEEAIAHINITQTHPEWVNQLVLSEGLPETIRSGSWLGETAIQGENGQEIPVSQLILAHRSETGEVEYFSTIARDISDRKQQENALRFVVEGTVSKTGEAFFQACVQHLAKIFQVQYAFITELVDEALTQSRILALWTGEGFAEPDEFNLAGTPCSVVFQESWGIFPDALQTQFPDADILATLGAESYLGMIIVDSQGKALGNLGIIDTKPLPENLKTAKSILQLFAARVGAEMERNAAQIKLQEQEQFLRTVYEGANQPIFVIDVLPNCEFRYVSWNAAAEAASGMLSQESSGKTPEEIYGLEAGALEHQCLQACLASQTAVTHEECLIFDGQESWWITTYNPIKDSHGKIYRFIGTTFDISDRKAAEATLSEYANRQTLLNQLVKQIRNSLDLDAVIDTTIQSIRDLLDIDVCAFAWYNPNVEPPIWHMIQEAKLEDVASTLGCYPVTFVGSIDQLLFNQNVLRIDDVKQYGEPIHQAFLNTINCQSEILLPIQTHANQIGAIICAHYRQVRPWTDSEVLLLKAVSDQLAIAIDQAELYAESRTKSQQLQHTLQELQRTQSQMVQAEKMSSLGQLVAGIAHEINNPVNFIHGNVTHAGEYVQDLLDLIALYQAEYPQPSYAIADKIEDMDLEFLHQDLTKILSSMRVGTERIRDIVKSLRIFSRLDESEVKSVDIHEGIDSTLMILHHRLKAKRDRVEIKAIANYGDLPLIECFPGQLNQVFMNILANAIDALEESMYKNILTETPTISIRTERCNNKIKIAIADNGPGISDDVKQRLFDPFFTTKPVGKGTGMGLSISYQIVTEKHQGKLLCRSKLGKGTEFEIEIPIQQGVLSS